MNLKSIDLNLLVAFDALMSERSVSRAAAKLGITQSAVSHALKRLRIMFGDPLMRRGSRGMEPTERALSLQQPVKGVLANIHSIISTKLAFDPATTKRTFKLSMSDAMSVEALPLIVRKLRNHAPNIDLLVTSSGPKDACARIINDEVEIAIGVFPHVQLDEIFVAMGLNRRVVAIVPHYIALPALIRGTDLIGHTRLRLVNVLRSSSNLVVFPIPARIRVPELSFEEIWHARYEDDPGHRWLRDLIIDAVRN